MRALLHLNRHRVRKGPFGSDDTAGNYGLFQIPLGQRHTAIVIASDGDETGWEHVSVHIRYKNASGQTIQRTPTWSEMCRIKSLFWEAEELVVQYHPPESQYVNTHHHTLHLWRPQGQEIPSPPAILV